MIKKRGMRADKLWIDDVDSYDEPKRLIIAAATVLDHPYHTVQPLGHDWYDMEDWARATMGRPGSLWTLKETHPERYFLNSGRFWFRDERDLNMFILKWT